MDLTDIHETSAEGEIDADSALGNIDEPEQSAEPQSPPKLGKPKVLKPFIWLILTLASVFFVAALNFMPMFYWLPPGLGETQFDAIGLRATILKNVDQGITYMLCSMGILLLHEFGHYIATRIYRIPST